VGHLPDNGLAVWGRGDQLTAEGLNGNFATLREYAERALTEARMPDPAVVHLEMRLNRIDERLDRIEQLLAMHERQRNEKEWAPLAHLGGVLQRLDGLQAMTEAAVARLEEAHAEAQAMHEDQHRRLARLEQQPEPATADAHGKLVKQHRKAARQASLALGQAIGLRQEVAHVRTLAEAHDRVANRLEFAPMATVAALLERIMRLENAP
jgi:chromosome segregation ATPase